LFRSAGDQFWRLAQQIDEKILGYHFFAAGARNECVNSREPGIGSYVSYSCMEASFMNNNNIASEKFSRLVPKTPPALGGRLSRTTAEQLISCLEQDVASLHPLLVSPGFQRLALWPVHSLQADGNSPERELIAKLKAAVLSAAARVRGFVEQNAELLAVHLGDAVRRYRRAKGWTIETAISLDDLLSRLEQVKAGCSDEWASIADYFGPNHGTSLEVGGERFRRGEFIVSLNEQLHYVGNHVATCMLVRANLVTDRLFEIASEINATLIAAGHSGRPWRPELDRIGTLLAQLRHACLEREEAVRAEAAMTVVQGCAAFSGLPIDWSWLPTDAQPSKSQLNMLRHIALGMGRGYSTALKIEAALRVVSRWWATRPLHQTALEEAIATGGLVVDVDSLKVYWQQQEVEGKWAKSPRKFLLLERLAKSRGRGHVTAADIYEDIPSKSRFPDLKKDLCNSLPKDLRERIQSVQCKNSPAYKFDLRSSQIHVISSENAKFSA